VSVVRTPAADAPRNGREADQSCQGLGRPGALHDTTEDGDALAALAAGPVLRVQPGQAYDLRAGRLLDDDELQALRRAAADAARQLAARVTANPSPALPEDAP